MGKIGATELILIVLAILLLFGARKIPELMRSLGSGVREFKKGARGEVGEDDAKPAKAPDAGKKAEEEKK
jgi:sec-independent protein translocase protein TatA